MNMLNKLLDENGELNKYGLMVMIPIIIACVWIVGELSI